MEKISPVKALNDYFNTGDNKKPLADFAKEVKALNPDEKAELAEGAANAMGKTTR